jgi:hypothetical protein
MACRDVVSIAVLDYKWNSQLQVQRGLTLAQPCLPHARLQALRAAPQLPE